MTSAVDALGWLAAIAGLIGTLLLAVKSRYSGWGFVCYLASNAGWIVFAVANDHASLLAQQIGFTITSCIGVYFWILNDAPSIEQCAGETLIPGGDVYLQLLEAHARIAELEQLAHGKKP